MTVIGWLLYSFKFSFNQGVLAVAIPFGLYSLLRIIIIATSCAGQPRQIVTNLLRKRFNFVPSNGLLSGRSQRLAIYRHWKNQMVFWYHFRRWERGVIGLPTWRIPPMKEHWFAKVSKMDNQSISTIIIGYFDNLVPQTWMATLRNAIGFHSLSLEESRIQ